MNAGFANRRSVRLLVALLVLGALTVAVPTLDLPGGDLASAAKRGKGKKGKGKKKQKRKAKACRAQKGAPVFRTPGYKGACRSPATEPAPPLPSVTLSPSGRWPNLLVDAAGTAHIVWTEEGGDGPDRLRYCRLKRAATACDNPPATADLAPEQPSSPGNTPDLSDDSAGPRVVAFGDDLALITFRYPYVMPRPVGPASSRSTYMWVSDDGGQSVTGPGLVGDLEPNGGVVAYGPPDQRRIGVIANRTGTTLFQAISPGTYTSAQAVLAQGGDRAYSGSLAEVDGRPLAAFADLSNRTYLRHWNGQGSANDAANWSEAQIDGTEPRLASGPAGTFLVTRPELFGPLQVRRLDGLSPGPPVTVADPGSVHRDLFADPGGAVRLAWEDDGDGRERILERSSRDGASFSAPRTLAVSDRQISDIDLGAAADGGGFAAYVAGAGSQGYGEVRVAPFGSQQATGVPGLGGQPGSGAAPDTSVSCQEIAYGVVQMLSPEGCLLSAPGKPGIKVSEGAIRLNGLEIVPEAGVKLLLGTRQKTIDSTGTVTVRLDSPGGPIVLFRGELHIKLSAASDGTRLATLDVSKFPVSVKGFPVKGDIDVILHDKAVEIPISLKLPKAFGGLTGGATLRASNTSGLEVSSLRFTVGNLALGPMTLKDLVVDWSSGGNWTGGAELQVAGAAIGARLEFSDGAFKRGFVTVTPVPFPGLTLFTNVFLNRVSGELWIDPFAFEAGAVFGAQPVAPPDTYVFGVDAKLKVSTKPVFAIDAQGAGRLAGLPLARAHFHGDAAGLFSMDASARIEVAKVVSASVAMSGFVDAGRGQFGAEASFDGCLGSPPFGVCSGFQGAVSSRGMAGCAGGFIGVGYHWGGDVKLLGPPSCDTGDYVVPVPASAAAAGGGDPDDPVATRTGGVPPTSGFTLPGGLPSATVRLTGAGGSPPRVEVVSPSGERIAPVPVGAAGAASAPVTVAEAGAEAYVGLRRPAGGAWRVEPTGGGSVTALAVARGLAPPKVSGKVARAGKGGRARVLSFRATSRPGLTVSFFEQVGSAGRLIATTDDRRGRIRFSAGDGPAGRRAIYALVEQNGLPRMREVIARYRAPGPIRPGKVMGLKVRRRPGSATVSWRRVPGAADYAVRVSISDGRTLLHLPTAPRLRLGDLSRADRLKVSVTARSALGRSGPAAKAASPEPRKRKPKRR